MLFDEVIIEKPAGRVTQLFIYGRKPNMLFVFTKQNYFKVPKDLRLKNQVDSNKHEICAKIQDEP